MTKYFLGVCLCIFEETYIAVFIQSKHRMTIDAEPIRTEIHTQAFVIKIFYIKYNNLAIIYLFLMQPNNNIIYIRTVLHTCK